LNRRFATAVGLCPLCGFSPPHFGPPQCCALLYRRAKTSWLPRKRLPNSRNVRCVPHTSLGVCLTLSLRADHRSALGTLTPRTRRPETCNPKEPCDRRSTGPGLPESHATGGRGSQGSLGLHGPLINLGATPERGPQGHGCGDDPPSARRRTCS
jgi:hypothetical protein